MCTIGASPLFGSLVNLYVLDNEISGIKTLGVCIRFGILEQGEEEFSRFDRPASFGDIELLSCEPNRVVSKMIRQRCIVAFVIRSQDDPSSEILKSQYPH